MKLDIRKKYSVFDIMILLTMIMLFALKNISVIAVYGWLLPAVLILVGYIQSKGWTISKNSLVFIVPYLAFLALCFASYLWAADKTIVVSQCYQMLRVYAGVCIFSVIILKLEDIEKLLHMFYITGVITLVHLFIRTPLSVWKDCLYGEYSASTDEGRLGYSIGYHPNGLGRLCVLIMMLSVFYYSKTKKKRYFLIAAVDLFVLAFTKSRASILMLVVGVVVYLLTSERKMGKKTIFIVCLAVSALVLYWMVFNVPTLYRLVGFRFDGALGGGGNRDASTETRVSFILYALKLFSEHPLIGVGIDNFKFYSYTFNNAYKEVYSHSNWAELLSCTGIIGTILFYLPQIASAVSLFRSLKKFDENRRRLCALFFSVLFTNIIYDFVSMSYDQMLVLLPTCLAIEGAYFLKHSVKNMPFDDKKERV